MGNFFPIKIEISSLEICLWKSLFHASIGKSKSFHQSLKKGSSKNESLIEVDMYFLFWLAIVVYCRNEMREKYFKYLFYTQIHMSLPQRLLNKFEKVFQAGFTSHLYSIIVAAG